MANEATVAVPQPQNVPPAETSHLKLMPKWIWLLGALIVIAGVVLVTGKSKFDEDEAFAAMKSCNASLWDNVLRGHGENRYRPEFLTRLRNGLEDYYASIHTTENRDAIAHVVELCDVEPQAGLRLFRRALESGNVSAKLVALYTANFLARAQNRARVEPEKGVLEANDFQAMVDMMDPGKEPDMGVRAAAMKAVSDLVVLTDTSAKESVEKLPDTSKEPEEPKEFEAVTKAVKTREARLEGKPVLQIRWSHVNIARAWWKEHAKAGAWDLAKQRFVIGK